MTQSISSRPFARLAAVLLALATVACGKARQASEGQATAECHLCHGGASGNDAPPTGLHGETAATALAVGAHQAHLADSEFRKAILCGDCHLVPSSIAGHGNTGQATLTFSALATQGGTAAWNRTTATCSNVYCHGDTLAAGGTKTKPVWTAPESVTCGTCHGLPPSGHSAFTTAAAVTDCHTCHSATVKPDGTIDVAGGHHIDGKLDLTDPATATCGSCHAAVPTTGAHAAHVKLANAAYGLQGTAATLDPNGTAGGYVFGCGLCHPTAAAKHGDGVVEVDLSPASGATGSLKKLNGAAAAYDKATGTCSNVYCHSSGQATPTFVTTPAWTSGTTLGCSGCHGDPPSYDNGGPATATANSHIFLNWTGRESGHFAGLPGSVHSSRHGAATSFGTDQAQAAPMTCQTCHADTVDPANVAPGGFFYLDTGITTRLAGGAADRVNAAGWKDTQCVTCHKAGGAPTGTGKVRPKLHVNGVRDVTFDRRTAPPAPWLFGAVLAGNAPTRPYFLTQAAFPGAVTLPSGAGFDAGGTLSYELSAASYAPANMTCSAVACHVGKPVVWGQKDFETATPTCTGCHGTL